MKKIICYLILILPGTAAIAQSLFHTVKLQAPQEADYIQGFTIGDSIMLVYNDLKLGPKALMIDSNGIESNHKIVGINGKNVIKISSTADSLYCYYLEDQKNLMTLRSIVWSKTTGKGKPLAQHLVLPNGLLGIRFNEMLSIVYAKSEDHSIHIAQIEGLEIKNDIKYEVGEEIFRKLNSAIKVVWEGVEVTPTQAESKQKVYVFNSEIIISIDAYTDFGGKTFISRINQSTGERTELVIEEKRKAAYHTFIHNNLIYKIGRQNGASISVLDMNLKEVYAFNINKETPFSTKGAYLRADDSNRVMGDRNVWDAISNTGSIFISVHNYDSSSVILKIGTHRPLQYGTPLSSNPLLFFATAIVRAMTLSVDQVKGINYYFYLVGNEKTGYTYTKSTKLLQQRIDDYELFNPKKKVDYSYKFYLKSKKFVYGIYKKEKSAELTIVRY